MELTNDGKYKALAIREWLDAQYGVKGEVVDHNGYLSLLLMTLSKSLCSLRISVKYSSSDTTASDRNEWADIYNVNKGKHEHIYYMNVHTLVVDILREGGEWVTFAKKSVRLPRYSEDYHRLTRTQIDRETDKLEELSDSTKKMVDHLLLFHGATLV